MAARCIDLTRTSIGDRHQSRLRLVNTEVHQLPDWRLPDELPQRIHSPQLGELRRGVRVVELPGRVSERRGVFLRWKWHKQRRQYQPLVKWSDGSTSFSDLAILELEAKQLCLTLNP